MNFLVIEDSPADFLMIKRYLKMNGVPAICTRVESIEALDAALNKGGWDVILSDYSIPRLNFVETLKKIQARLPDKPLILLSGSIGEEKAVELLKLGIHDFVLKDNLARLVPAIQRSLNEIEVHRARRRAEKKLRESEELARQRLAEIEAIYRTAPVGLCVLDTGLKFLRINAQMAEINGMPAEDHIGRTVREILPGMADQVEPLLLSVMQTGLPLRDSEISGETAARPGVLRTWRHSVHPLKTSDGKIIGLNTVIEEITERKKAQEALSALNKELKQRTELAEARARQLNHLAVELIEAEERERRRLSELLHDDLQQTLAAARMNLQAVGQRLASDPLLARVEGLLNEAIGKSRSLSHELSPSVLYHSGLSAALKWIVGQMEERFGLRADLEIGCDQKRCESEPVKVFIFRAAHELLFNVVKHAGVKSAKILLSCPDNQMVLTISDRGRGFNPEELELNTKSGLGLLSLRERARNFGGRLVIDSGPGKGSQLMLIVPLSAPIADEPPQLGPGADKPPDIPALPFASTTAGVTRVFFVDDHKVMRQGLVKLIAGQPGIHVVGEAANGLEAVEMTKRLNPDVIIMDVSMPEMDGIEATRRIKNELPKVRVVGLSMYEDEHISKAMCEAGAESFVSKNASPARLLNAIYGAAQEKKLPY